MEILIVQQVFLTTIIFIIRVYMVNGTVSEEKMVFWLLSQLVYVLNYAFAEHRYIYLNMVLFSHMYYTAYIYALVSFWSAWFLKDHIITTSINVKLTEKLECFLNSLFFWVACYILVDIINTIFLGSSYFSIFNNH